MVQMANLGLFWDTYVGHDEVGQLQDVTIIAVIIFGFMNFPQNCTQGAPGGLDGQFGAVLGHLCWS